MERSHGQGWREGQGQERERGRYQPRDRYERDRAEAGESHTGAPERRDYPQFEDRERQWRGGQEQRYGYPEYEQQRFEQERYGHEAQHERPYERQGSEGYGQSWYGQGSQGYSSQGYRHEDYARREPREPQAPRRPPQEQPGYGGWGQGGSQRSYYPSSGTYGAGGSYGAGVSGMGSYGAQYGYRMGAAGGEYGSERDMWRDRQPRRGRPPRTYKRGDERIRDEICELIARDSDVDASEVDIQVVNGEVTLTGTVENRAAKRELEDLTERVFGVSDIHNNVKPRRSLLNEIGDKLFGNGGGTPTASKDPPSKM